jgi:hypothetical protein
MVTHCRFSATIPGYYTMSYVAANNQTMHFRVQYTPGTGYTLNNTAYNSLLDIVRLYKDSMNIPVEGGKYAKIFADFAEVQKSYIPR